MSAKVSPLFNDAQLDNNGIPLSGGKIYWYLAGTTTPASVYQDSLGTVPHTSPIILNTRGEPPAPIWLTTGPAYKVVLTDALNAQIRVVDNISGVNDVGTPTISEWILYAGTPSYISGSSFSVVGDLRTTFTYFRRIKVNVTGGSGICYATISIAPTFSLGVTTVTVSVDSGSPNIDTGINNLYYGFLNPAYPSFNVAPSVPSGAAMPFYMTNPPAGWTSPPTGTAAGNSQNDSMLRVVTFGTTGGNVGTGAGHSPVVNSVVPYHTHLTTGTTGPESSAHTHIDGGHTHAVNTANITAGPGAALGSSTVNSSFGTGIGYASLGSETAQHSHYVNMNSDGGSSQTNWQPRYMDFCIGIKT